MACLQAVAHACGGAQYASFESILRAIKDHRECRVLLDENDEPSVSETCRLVDDLVNEYLVERKKIKDKSYVGLTEDGRRCNLIEVY